MALPENNGSLMFETPPPPTAYFPETFLALPGILAGLPLVVAGVAWNRDWLVEAGLIIGAVFFWYCVGWKIDAARAVITEEKLPMMVRWHLTGLILLAIVLLPLGLVVGLGLGVHSCASEVPPYWVELVSYAILMFLDNDWSLLRLVEIPGKESGEISISYISSLTPLGGCKHASASVAQAAREFTTKLPAYSGA
jgi:hypothetical protein